MAPGGPVRDQRGDGLLAAPSRQDAALLQPDRDHRPPRGRLAQVPVPRAGEDHSVLDRDAVVREVHGADRGRGDLVAMTRALALIDGEHYAPTVRAALAELPYEFVGAYMVGGTEKLRGNVDYGVSVYDDLEAALRELEPALVLDLSDEPVLGPAARFRVASRVLAAGIPYAGADFRLEPPELEAFPLPSLSVFATGKRVGKTAVSAHIAGLLSRDRDVIAVAMGRGGPKAPAVAESPPSLEELLSLSRGGSHAASDYLEIAVVARVVTIGCRRCGGGLAGAVVTSNVQAGAELAMQRRADFVVFDGSGAAIPPVATGKRVLVTSAFDRPEFVTGYLNAYRILLADLVLVTMADESTPHEVLADAIREVKPDANVIAV